MLPLMVSIVSPARLRTGIDRLAAEPPPVEFWKNVVANGSSTTLDGMNRKPLRHRWHAESAWASALVADSATSPMAVTVSWYRMRHASCVARVAASVPWLIAELMVG